MASSIVDPFFLKKGETLGRSLRPIFRTNEQAYEYKTNNIELGYRGYVDGLGSDCSPRA
jgi:hypothetical protein